MTTMKMIRIFTKLLLAAAIAAASARAAPPVASFEAILVLPDGTTQPAFVITATKASIRYRETKDGAEIRDRKLSELATVRIAEPREFATAIDLFQSRRYQEAKKSFSALRESFKAIATLPDNPSTLSAFYELECLRKLGDLEGLSEALKKFNKDPLVREDHLRQIEMYIFWDAVRTKNWGRLESLAKDREKQRLPGYQRAQVAYCHALALEALGKTTAALDAYNIALTADLGASEEISRKSALAILKLLSADPAVKEALKQPEAAAPSERLQEARSLAKLFELSLGSGVPLPEEYRVFLK